MAISAETVARTLAERRTPRPVAHERHVLRLFADAHKLRTEPVVAEALQRAVNRLADAAALVLARGQANGTT